MPVPLLDLKPQNLALEEGLKEAFQRVLHSGQYILGPEVEAFERETAAFLGVRHSIGVSSGTDALLLALMALGIGPGDEVICPSFTFFATAGSIARTGATPVFADSSADSFNIDVDDVMRRLTPRTRAIMPVHLYGQPAAMDPLMELARAHRLHVIEDAAQSFGATCNGKASGTIGCFGAFSFFPSKNLGGFGDAGLLVTDDDALAERARILRVHGMQPKYFHKWIGANFRVDALQAALLRVKLPHLQTYAERRRANASHYTDRLSKLPEVALGCGENRRAAADREGKAGAKLLLPGEIRAGDHVWNQYTVQVLGDGRRDALKALLTERGIGSEIYYPLPLHQQECFVHLVRSSLPVAEHLARVSLSLPVYPELSSAQRDEVVAAVADFIES